MLAVLLLHGADDHDLVTLGDEAEVLHDLRAVGGGGHAALLVGAAAAVDDLLVLIALIGVVGPVLDVADADGVDVGVERDDLVARAHPADDVAELVELDLIIARAKCGVTYDDMAESAAYTAAVDLAEHGVFVGAQVGSRRFFEPDRAVSRGEFVTMALACAGIPAGDLMMTGFCDDAEIPTWAKGSAVSALQCGLIRGVGTEGGMAFCADEGVTLSEAATVLNRLLRVTDVDLSDYDAGSADAWSAQAVANLESVRVIESGSFSAGDWQRPLTRGEAAQLLSAAMTLAEKKQESAGLLSGLFQ